MARGQHEFTAQQIARTALIDAVKVALEGEDVDIGRGFRWPFVSRDWVFATETDSDIDPAGIGPRRSMDERITLTLSIGAWRAGADQETEDIAFNRAFELLARIQEHVRRNDPQLGAPSCGACRARPPRTARRRKTRPAWAG